MYTKNKYIYDYDKDIYICPNNVALIYKTRLAKAIKNIDVLRRYVCVVPIKINVLERKLNIK